MRRESSTLKELVIAVSENEIVKASEYLKANVSLNSLT